MASSSEEYLKSGSKIGLLGHNDMFCSGFSWRWSGKYRGWGRYLLMLLVDALVGSWSAEALGYRRNSKNPLPAMAALADFKGIRTLWRRGKKSGAETFR